ncbi:UPF0266 membrane protein YobD [Salmonella enterica subsp. enterica serovar Choleraesuis]|nr:UPF0266 membrane protein YobD [Salmonella enterica subsp. enterica serovar Choleraesuis]
MSMSDLVLVVMAGGLLLWAIYEEFIVNFLRGPTRLKISLLKRKPIDSAIFILLIVILIYKNNEAHGSLITTWLLCALALISAYQGWLRQPKLIFKDSGFFYNGIWVSYTRIQQMNLSEDGVLVMQLEKRRLLIRVRKIDDLEKIYKLMVTTQ